MTATREFHPLAALFPMLDPDSSGFRGLCEDIDANGQHEPIWLYEEKILDGRNRANACQHLGIEPEARDYVGNDPIGFVLSVNLHRRHLNTSQRAMVAAKLATFTHGGDRSKAPNGGLTDAAAAKLLRVGERSVERARQVLAKGDPSLIGEVEKGNVTVTDAAATATGGNKGTGEGNGKKNGATARSIYGRVEQKLIESLIELKPNEVDIVATGTIKRLKETVAELHRRQKGN